MEPEYPDTKGHKHLPQYSPDQGRRREDIHIKMILRERNLADSYFSAAKGFTPGGGMQG